MPECWISLTTDLCVVSSILNPHQQISSATGVTIPPYTAWDLEAVTNMYWPPGVAVGKNKFTDTVKHKNLCITKDGHDLGPLLIHAPIPGAPDDFMFAVHTLKSSRKVNFSAGMVLANGDPVACAWFPVFPMTGCADPISLPTATPPTCALNSVVVNMHWVDVVAGFIQIAADMLLDYIKGKLSKGPDPTSMSHGLGKAVTGGSFDPRVWAGEQILGNAGGMARLAGRGLCDDYHGPASISVGIGQGMIGGVSSEYKSTDDGTEVQYGGNAAGGLLGASRTHSRGNDGTSQTTSTQRAAGFQRSQTDGSGPTSSQSWL